MKLKTFLHAVAQEMFAKLRLFTHWLMFSDKYHINMYSNLNLQLYTVLPPKKKRSHYL